MKLTQFILFGILLSSPAMATSTLNTSACNQQFVGSVEDIIDDSAFDYSLVKVKVIFKRLEVIKGIVPQNIILDVLKHGPFEFIKGQSYSVQLQDGSLCWADKQ